MLYFSQKRGTTIGLHFVARPVEKSDGDGLPLNGRGLLVSVLVDNSQDLVVESRLLPVPDGRGNVAATHTDVVVLTENTPITLQQARSAHQLNSIQFYNLEPVLKSMFCAQSRFEWLFSTVSSGTFVPNVTFFFIYNKKATEKNELVDRPVSWKPVLYPTNACR